MPQQKREVPHHHACVVDGRLIGCENRDCVVEYWTVCRDEMHIEIYKRSTMHLHVVDGVLPCCGKRLGDTTPGDRMTYDARKVTCSGGVAQVALARDIVHDPFGAEAQAEAAAATMAGPGIVE